MEPQRHSIKFEGETYEYDANALKSWSVQRAIAEQRTDPARMFAAFDRVFCGDADAVAARLGDDMTKVNDLINRCAEAVGAEAKN